MFSSASSGSETLSDSDTSSLTTALFKRHLAANSSEDSSSNPRFTEVHDSSEDDGSSENKYDDEDHHRSPIAVDADTESSVGSQQEERDEDFQDAGPQTNKLLKKMYGLGFSSSEDDESEDWANIGIRVEPEVRRRKSDETLRSASVVSKASTAFRDISDPTEPVLLATAVASAEDEEYEADPNDDADDEGSRTRRSKT